MRSARYTMLVENNVIKAMKLEEDTAACEISAAENFIKEIQFSIAWVASSSAKLLYLLEECPLTHFQLTLF